MSEVIERTEESSTEPQSATPQIPKDLKDQWGAVQALAMAFKVIKDATHQQHNFQAVDLSMRFLKDMHDQTFDACAAHESAALIPEIKEILNQKEALEKAQIKRAKKAQKKEAKDGEKEINH